MNSGRVREAAKAVFFRSKRVYVANSGWWFDSREGIQFGPFTCKGSADCALAVYVAQQLHDTRHPQARTSEPPGLQDGIPHMVEEIADVLTQHRDFGALAAINWAKSRIEQLRQAGTQTPTATGRLRVLEYLLNYPERSFHFDRFLDGHAW